MHAADETVLDLVERTVCDPQVIEAAVGGVVHALSQRHRSTAAARRQDLSIELRRIEDQLVRDVTMIA